MIDLDILNPNQRQAVLNTQGPLLVLAGAGTGKTTVIAYKISYLLEQEICAPENILAVTFTNRAAYQMQSRISRLANQKINYLGTFHSINLHILRNHAHLVGLQQNLTIIDQADQIKLIKNIYLDNNFDSEKLDYKTAHHLIGSWKDLSLSPEQVEYHDRNAVEIYKHYQKRLHSSNLADFGDILFYVNDIFNQHADVREMYQEQFKYILVDEYQDTNKIQYDWIRHLTKNRQNICCVGDDDQSIYSWRGAQIGNILNFNKDFKDTKIITLSQNYRSTQKILDVAQSIIRNNQERYDKNLTSHLTNSSNNKSISCSGHTINRPIKLICCANSYNEADFISQEVLKLSKGFSIGVLVRTNFQTRVLEDTFLRNKINYKIVGTLKFYELKEVKDVICYVRAALNPSDDIAFERIINVPKRGVGDVTLAKARSYSFLNNVSLSQGIQMLLNTGQIGKKSAIELKDLLEGLKRWKIYFSSLEAHMATQKILEESKYMNLLSQNILEYNRLDNIKELILTIAEYNDIHEFLEHAALVNDNNKDDSFADPLVQIMTVHSAKGLEFDTVFLPNWNQGIFPSNKGLSNLAEERRIAYVAVTRAKKELYISYAANLKTKDNYYVSQSPSIFIDEINAHIQQKVVKKEVDDCAEECLVIQENFPNYSWDKNLFPGTRIKHQIFGLGLVIKDLGFGKYEIALKDHGIKVIHKDFLHIF